MIYILQQRRVESPWRCSVTEVVTIATVVDGQRNFYPNRNKANEAETMNILKSAIRWRLANEHL